MANVLRDLVVSLSLDSDQFSRSIRLINKEIREEESMFKLAGAGVDNYEKTLDGARNKADLLTKQIKHQRDIITQQTNALAQANQRLRDQQEQYKNLGNSLLAATQAEKESAQQLEHWQEQLKYVSVEFGEESFQAEAARAEVERYSQAHADAAAEVNRLRGQITATENSMVSQAGRITDANTAFNENLAKLKELEKEYEKFAGTLNQYGAALLGFSEKAKAASREITTTGKTLTKSITVPIVGAGTAAAKAAIDYESAFAGVRKTVNATEEEFKSFSKDIIDMSQNLATSASDIAGVMEIAGQLGIQNDALKGFTETVVRLGMSTNLAGEDAASAMAKFANVTKMSQKDFGNMGATIVALGNSYATTEADIMRMATRIAAAGHQVGMSNQDILGFATALSSLGVEAEAGGTAFSTAMKKIEIAVQTGNKQLADFADVAGMTEEAFSALWKSNPAEAFQAFIGGLGKLNEEDESAIARLDEMGLSGIRLSDTLLRQANATELVASAVKMANDAWADGTALMTESDTRLGTTQSKLTNLKNTVVALAIGFGEQMLPTIQELADKAKNVLERFKNMDDSTKSSIIKWGALAAAVGPVVIGFGKVVGAVGSVAGGIGNMLKVIAKVPAAFTAIRESAAIMGSMIGAGGPVMLAIAGASAAIMALMKRQRDFEASRPDFSVDASVIEQYKVEVPDIKTSIDVEANVGTISGDIATVGEKIKEILNDGLPEGPEEEAAMVADVNAAIDSAFASIENEFNTKKAELDTLYQGGLIDTDAYNTGITDLTAQADSMKEDLTSKADALTDYISILCANNRAMTDAEFAELERLLEQLSLTAETVSKATDAEMASYEAAYKRTQAGVGDDADRTKAYQYIELMTQERLNEIEAEEAALKQYEDSLEAGKSAEEIRKINAEMQKDYDSLDDERRALEADRKEKYMELMPINERDMEATLGWIGKFREALNEYNSDTLGGGGHWYDFLRFNHNDILEAMGLPNDRRDFENAEDMINWFLENNPKIQEYVNTLAAQGVIDAGDLQKEYGMIDVLESILGDVNTEDIDKMEKDVETATEEVEKIKEDVQALQMQMNDMPVYTSTTALTESLKAANTEAAAEMDTAANDIVKKSENIMPGVGQAISDTSGGFTRAMQTAAQSGAELWADIFQIHSPSRKMYGYGVNIMAGLRNGIIAGQSGVVEAMRQAARAAVNAAKQELQIHSPSRVFENEVGQMVMKGFGKGIMDEVAGQAKVMKNAAQYLTDEAKGAFGNVDNRKTYNNDASVTLTGNTFVLNDQRDVEGLAQEIAALTRQQQRGRGLRMA